MDGCPCLEYSIKTNTCYCYFARYQIKKRIWYKKVSKIGRKFLTNEKASTNNLQKHGHLLTASNSRKKMNTTQLIDKSRIEKNPSKSSTID